MRRVLVWVVGVSLGAALPWVAACSRQNPADRTVEQLKSDIAKLQADRDRIDQRLGALEAVERPHDDSPTVSKASGAPLPETVPRLTVVRIGDAEKGAVPLPGEGEVSDTETNGGDPRPVVQATGSPLAKRGRSGSRGDVPAFSPEAKREYEAALALVRGKQYERALEAFTSFLVRHPDHPYAENATYWRGEAFYAKGDYAKAAEQFEGLMARFAYGNKAPDALLKLGLCQQRLGSQDLAQKTFTELRDRYPKSEAARQAPRP